MHRLLLTSLIMLGAVTGTSVMGVLPAGASPARPERPSREISAPTKTTYTVHGRASTLTCAGKGRVPVVFLAGGNDPGTYWSDLIAKLGPSVLTCVFDRPGVGTSSPSPALLTPKAVASTLKATLVQANIGKRFVLVGHSIGGANALVYGASYPRQVAGAVLLDPSEAAFFKLTHAEPILESLGYAPKKTEAQIAAVTRWPKVPLTVLSRDPKKGIADGTYTAAQEAVWSAGSRKYAKLSPIGSRSVVPNTSHYVYIDAPDVAAAAIRNVLKRATVVKSR